MKRPINCCDKIVCGIFLRAFPFKINRCRILSKKMIALPWKCNKIAPERDDDLKYR